MIGIDIVELEEIAKIANIDGFLDKYFTKEEKKYIETKAKKQQTIAGIFCAKEAVLKSLKVGIGNGIALKEVEILHETCGAPYLVINQKISDAMKSVGCLNAEISISHSKNYAVAICKMH